MSDGAQKPAVRRGPPPMSGPARFMGGGPIERSADFKGSLKRLVGLMRPDRFFLYLVLVLGTASVSLTVTGPRILGHATDLIFAGVIGRRIHGGTKQQALDALRAHGSGKIADMLSGIDFTPGKGIDFGAIGNVLLLALGVYVTAALLSVVQMRTATKVINRTVFRLREDVQAKLSRLPLSYFDQQPRGEVLSRATNDIDNIGQTMQQTMGQLVNSLLTIVGVLAMMFWISLAAGAGRAGDRAGVGGGGHPGRQAGAAAVRAAVEDHRQAQRAHRGDVHRARPGEGLRPGQRSPRSCSTSRTRHCSVRLQGAVHQRHHAAADDVRRQPELRAGGGRRRAAGGVRRAVHR